MSYKLKNTALDHTKRFLHRTASKMQMEPVIGGRRLRIRSSMIISDEIFEHNKANLALWRGWGVVDWEQVGGEKSVEKPSVTKTGPLPVLTPEGESVFDVVLVEVGESPILVVKVLRERTSLDIKEASDLLAMVPVAVLTGANDAAATDLAAALTEAGAKVDKVKLPTVPKESPHAETTPEKTKPQPKSPFKGKKQ